MLKDFRKRLLKRWNELLRKNDGIIDFLGLSVVKFAECVSASYNGIALIFIRPENIVLYPFPINIIL